VESLEGKLRRSRSEVVEDAKQRADAVQNDAAFAEYVLRTAPNYALTIKEIALRIKKTVAGAEKIVERMLQSGAIFSLEQGLLIHSQTLVRLKQQALDRVSEYHRKDPASTGMEMETCQKEWEMPKPVFQRLLKDLRRNKIRIQDNRLSLTGHNAHGCREAEAPAAGGSPISTAPIHRREGGGNGDLQTRREGSGGSLRLLGSMDVWCASRGTCTFTARHWRKHSRSSSPFEKRKTAESVQFKYLIDATRKIALPLLDYLDR
jgi:hypothetical protein